MGCASPLAGSEEEAVAAWGRPAPDTTAAAILVDLIKDASSAVIRIPLLAPSVSWKLRDQEEEEECKRRKTFLASFSAGVNP
ncbi:hypothetical protein BHE74_00020421 [Ensete ventricosum]|nr:hypothetical protein BHE74_00020421 [Ensete ventricosum]